MTINMRTALRFLAISTFFMQVVTLISGVHVGDTIVRAALYSALFPFVGVMLIIVNIVMSKINLRTGAVRFHKLEMIAYVLTYINAFFAGGALFIIVYALQEYHVLFACMLAALVLMLGFALIIIIAVCVGLFASVAAEGEKNGMFTLAAASLPIGMEWWLEKPVYMLSRQQIAPTSA